MLDYILDRLSEASTWKGIVWFATAFGLVLSPDQQEAIASFGMTLIGLISVFVEKGNTKTDDEMIEIVQEQHQKTVKKMLAQPKVRKNERFKKTDSDNFFND